MLETWKALREWQPLNYFFIALLCEIVVAISYLIAGKYWIAAYIGVAAVLTVVIGFILAVLLLAFYGDDNEPS